MIQGGVGQVIAAHGKAAEVVAVLVDGENINQGQANLILDSAARCGAVNIRRVYGDMALLRDWEADHRFHPIHTGHGRSKNTADINLVIDAMDLAHSGHATAFVIVSCDGDFAPLATRLREAGLSVTGIGRKAVAQSFREACTDFHCILDCAAIPVAAMPPLLPAAPPAVDVKIQKRSVIDDAIHRICRKHGGQPACITLIMLGNLMPNEEKIARNQTGKPTWRAFLELRQDLYVLEGTGQGSKVRLRLP